MLGIDAYEKAPYLHARWKGGEDLKKGIEESLEVNGKCRQILQDLKDNRITIDEAISKLTNEIDSIHHKTHNK